MKSYLSLLSRGFDELFSKKPDVEGFREDLERFYRTSISSLSPGDALLVGINPDLKLAVNAGLMIYDRIVLLDYLGYVILKALEAASVGIIDDDLTNHIMYMLSQLRRIEEYDLVLVFPHRRYLSEHSVFDPWRRFEREFSEEPRLKAFFDLVLKTSYKTIPEYYFKGLLTAQVLGSSLFTTDPYIILGTGSIGVEHIDIASDEITERYLLGSKHLSMLEARKLKGIVARMNIDEIKEIRSKYPPGKVRRSLKDYEPEIPKEASISSFALPLFSLLSSFFPGLAAIFSIIDLGQNIVELSKAIISRIQRFFGRGEAFVMKFYEEIPKIGREFKKKPLYKRLRDSIRGIFNVL